MAQSPNEKAAKAIVKALDSMSLNPAVVANLTIGEMSSAQQQFLFELTLHAINEWTFDDISGYAGPDRKQRVNVSKALKTTIERMGYTMN